MEMKRIMRPNSSALQPGQSLVEMGLMLMVLLWLLAGAVDFGIAFFTTVALRDAAQEGALYGALNPPGASCSPDIIYRVQDSGNKIPIDLTKTTVTCSSSVTCVTSSATSVATVSVTVTYDYYAITPLIESFLSNNPIVLSGSATSPILKICPPET
jgi:Flp pilus assembly protein TadG